MHCVSCNQPMTVEYSDDKTRVSARCSANGCDISKMTFTVGVKGWRSDMARQVSRMLR